MPELPNNWKECRLVDVVDPGRRVTYGIVQPGPRQPNGEGIPLIRGQDYSAGEVVTEGLYWVRSDIAAAYQRSTVRGGDILISIVGYVGLVAQVPDPLTGANITQTTARVAINRDNEARYFLHQFRSNEFAREVRRYTKGSAQPGLNLADVEVLRVKLPPLLEQSRIAAILDTIDEANRKTEQVIAKLKQVKQGLFHDLLTRGVDDNGELRDPERHPEQFKDSPLGRIPRMWDAEPLERLLAPVNPAMRSGPFGSALLKSELVEHGVPLAGIDNVLVEHFENRFTRFVTPRKAAELSRYLVRPSDVMITIMGTVGRCCVVPDDVGPLLSTKHVWTLTIDPVRYSPFLVCAQINHAPWVLRHFSRDEQGGIMSAIRSETLRTTLLPVPPPAELNLIAERLYAHDMHIKTESAALAKLRLLKQGLMDDLFTGRVRVTPLLEANP